jgi:hypothetical protein
MSRYAVVGRGRTLLGMELDTRQRPSTARMEAKHADDGVLYVRSYLLTRTVIGTIGMLLPLALVILEGAFTHQGLRPQDSISAYYHTTAGEDLLVAGLSVVAVMLLTYMSGQPRSVDFVASTVTGAALLGVVFFPTQRGGDLRQVDPRPCGPGTHPQPVSCSPTESTFGEHTVSVVHDVCACVFFLGLVAIAVAFAYRERQAHGRWSWSEFGYLSSGVLILAFGIMAFFNFDIGRFHSLFLGEVGGLLSFGLSWFLNGEGLRFVLLKPHRGSPEGRTVSDAVQSRADAEA